MSEKTIKAFPTQTYDYDGNNQVLNFQEDGMDLLDYFAAKAMAAMITTAATPCLTGVGGLEERIAKASYVMADAMMEARKK